MNPLAIMALISAVFSAVYGGFSVYNGFEISILWRVPVIFICGFIALYILAWLPAIIVSFTINKNKAYEKPTKFHTFLINMGYSLICSSAGIKLKVSGVEKIPQGRFLLVCNHLSRFDNMLICTTLGMNQIAFISKPENFAYPVAGKFMKRLCYIPVERATTESGRKSVERACSLIRNDYCSVGVFPEGRRGNGESLQKFHAGCLKTATQTDCPVLVCAVNGTHLVHKRFPLHTTVTLDFLEVISSEGKRTVDLSDEIYSIIDKHLYNKNKE